MTDDTQVDPRITVPTTVYAAYWPASILIPVADGPPEVRRRVRAYLTDTGLHVFYTRPSDELVPDLFAPIDFARTPPPDVNASQVGVDVYLLAAGGEPVDTPIVITPHRGNCGCGATLRYWKPSWARDTSPWPTP